MISLRSEEALQPSHRVLRLFVPTLISLALTCLSVWGIAAGGMGPCGGAGALFIIPTLFFALLTVILLLRSCMKTVVLVRGTAK